MFKGWKGYSLKGRQSAIGKSVHIMRESIAEAAYLRRDQGRKTTTSDETHCCASRSLSEKANSVY